MSKKEAGMVEKITSLMEARYRLQIEMLEKLNAALVDDNNQLAADLQAAQRDQYVSLGLSP